MKKIIKKGQAAAILLALTAQWTLPSLLPLVAAEGLPIQFELKLAAGTEQTFLDNYSYLLTTTDDPDFNHPLMKGEVVNGQASQQEAVELNPDKQYLIRIYEANDFAPEGQDLSLDHLAASLPQAFEVEGFATDANGRKYFQVRLDSGHLDEADAGLLALELNFQALTSNNEEKPTVEEATLSVLRFELKDPQGHPLENYGVELSGDKVQLADAQGVAEFNQLPAGDYTYRILDPEGQEISSDTLHLKEASVFTLPLEIETAESEAADNLSRLSFQLTDAQGQPLAAYRLVLNGDQEELSDAEGIMRFDDLPSADYSFRLLDPEGEEVAAGSLFLKEGSEFTYPIQLEAADPLGQVHVSVTDEAGQVVEGALIKLQGPEGDLESVTDAQGQTYFEALTPGTYDLSIHYQDAVSDYEPVTVLAEQDVTLELKLTQQENSAGSLRFVLKDENDLGLEGIQLKLDETVYTTDSEGQIVLEDLVAGTYAYEWLDLPETYEALASETIDLAAGQELLIEDTLTPKAPVEEVETGAVDLLIKDGSGQALQGAKVKLIQAETVYEGSTDAEGRSHFEHLPAGAYQVQVEWEGQVYQDLPVVQVKDGAAVDQEIKLEAPAQATYPLVFKAIDQDDQVVEGLKVKLGDQVYTTDANGEIRIEDLGAGDYQYEILELPDKYHVSQTEGELKLEEALVHTLHVEREITPGHALITVKDQDQKVISGVKVKFGGLTGVTDKNGQLSFTDLEPGKYYYSVIEVPNSYRLSGEELVSEITEGANFEAELKIEKSKATAKVEIVIKDDQGQPVPGVVLAINNQQVITNQAGVAIIEGLSQGDYYYQILEVPAGYQLSKTQEEKLTLTEGSSQQVKTQVLKVKGQESASQQPTTPSKEQAPAPNTKRFVDNATGIELYVDEQDAEKIVRLQVEVLNSDQVLADYPNIPLLKDRHHKVYALSLIGRDQQEVHLSRLAEVVIPEDTQDLSLLIRLSSQGSTHLNYQLQGGKISFKTQTLGRFALLYGPASDQGSAVKVTKTTGRQSKEDLPQTGETTDAFLSFIALTSLIAGASILYRRRKM